MLQLINKQLNYNNNNIIRYVLRNINNTLSINCRYQHTDTTTTLNSNNNNNNKQQYINSKIAFTEKRKGYTSSELYIFGMNKPKYTKLLAKHINQYIYTNNQNYILTSYFIFLPYYMYNRYAYDIIKNITKNGQYKLDLNTYLSHNLVNEQQFDTMKSMRYNNDYQQVKSYIDTLHLLSAIPLLFLPLLRQQNNVIKQITS